MAVDHWTWKININFVTLRPVFIDSFLWFIIIMDMHTNYYRDNKQCKWISKFYWKYECIDTKIDTFSNNVYQNILENVQSFLSQTRWNSK